MYQFNQWLMSQMVLDLWTSLMRMSLNYICNGEKVDQNYVWVEGQKTSYFEAIWRRGRFSNKLSHFVPCCVPSFVVTHPNYWFLIVIGLKKNRSSGWRAWFVWLTKQRIIISRESASSSSSNALQWEARSREAFPWRLSRNKVFAKPFKKKHWINAEQLWAHVHFKSMGKLVP